MGSIRKRRANYAVGFWVHNRARLTAQARRSLGGFFLRPACLNRLSGTFTALFGRKFFSRSLTPSVREILKGAKMPTHRRRPILHGLAPGPYGIMSGFPVNQHLSGYPLRCALRTLFFDVAPDLHQVASRSRREDITPHSGSAFSLSRCASSSSSGMPSPRSSPAIPW